MLVMHVNESTGGLLMDVNWHTSCTLKRQKNKPIYVKRHWWTKTKLREGTKQTAKDAYANIFISETRTRRNDLQTINRQLSS